MLRRMAAPVAALALAGFVAGAAPAGASHIVTKTFTTDLNGFEEAPGPGDPDGSGVARVTVDTATGRICYVIRVANIAPATAAHIHEAPPGQAGPVRQGLIAPTRGRSAGCVTNYQLAGEIAADPGDYYVNVHNPMYPGGAVRGQL